MALAITTTVTGLKERGVGRERKSRHRFPARREARGQRGRARGQAQLGRHQAWRSTHAWARACQRRGEDRGPTGPVFHREKRGKGGEEGSIGPVGALAGWPARVSVFLFSFFSFPLKI
jgi:hypothetical protein